MRFMSVVHSEKSYVFASSTLTFGPCLIECGEFICSCFCFWLFIFGRIRNWRWCQKSVLGQVATVPAC